MEWNPLGSFTLGWGPLDSSEALALSHEGHIAVKSLVVCNTFCQGVKA